MGTLQEFVDSCDRVDAVSDGDDWWMTWLDSRRERQTVILRVRLDTRSGDIANELWEIRCQNTRAFSLGEIEFTDWTLSEDHVLLWDFQKPISQLFFRGPESRHEKVLWNLYERHRSLVEHWIPFERYINNYFLRNGLSGGFGFLAEGPDHLLREYAAVLTKSDLEPYFPYSPRPARRWDEECGKLILEDQGMSAFILGRCSYIVAESFAADRVNG